MRMRKNENAKNENAKKRECEKSWGDKIFRIPLPKYLISPKHVKSLTPIEGKPP